MNGSKRKTPTPWTERLFVHGRAFVGEGADVLARNFDDFEQMRPYGLQSVVNVPLLQGNLCYATFNVFGTRARWLPQQIWASACWRWPRRAGCRPRPASRTASRACPSPLP